MILRRTELRPDGIFGEFRAKAGDFNCVTIEHAYSIDSESWFPKVPAGIYACKRRKSPHFGFDVFQVMDVPNCTYIEIHPGNFDKSSDGCICVGEAIAQYESAQMITHSDATFEKFMALQAGVQSFQLSVIDQDALTAQLAA